MPCTSPDFDRALFKFRIFLKLGAPTCLGPGASCPPPCPPLGGPGYCPKIAKNLGKSTVFRALRSRWVAKSCKLTILPAYNPPKTAAKMDVQIVGKGFFKVVVFKISHRFCPWTHLRLSNHEPLPPPSCSLLNYATFLRAFNNIGNKILRIPRILHMLIQCSLDYLY